MKYHKVSVVTDVSQRPNKALKPENAATEQMANLASLEKHHFMVFFSLAKRGIERVAAGKPQPSLKNGYWLGAVEWKAPVGEGDAVIRRRPHGFPPSGLTS